jgi:hypothetical protein
MSPSDRLDRIGHRSLFLPNDFFVPHRMPRRIEDDDDEESTNPEMEDITIEDEVEDAEKDKKRKEYLEARLAVDISDSQKAVVGIG